LEETGLIVNEIVGEIPPFEYSVEKILGGIGSTTSVKTTLQLNFVAKVAPISPTESLKVIIDPQEHQNYVWVSKDDLDRYNITEGMKKIVMDALDWGENNLGRVVSDWEKE